MSEETVARTAEEKAQMYSAMLGSVSVITNALSAANEFCSDMTDEELKERVMRSSGYLSAGVALDDWGDEDMSTINAAITAAEAAQLLKSMEALDLVNTMWPIAVGFITLVIVLAKMHGDIETIKEKVKLLFELWNKKDQ